MPLPHVLDKPVHRHHPVRLEQQHGEHRPLPRTGQRHRAAGPEHLQRPEDTECVRPRLAGRLFRSHHTSPGHPPLTPPRQRILTIPSPVHGDSKRALQAGHKAAPSVTRCPASTHNTQEAIMFTRIPRTRSQLRTAARQAAARPRRLAAALAAVTCALLASAIVPAASAADTGPGPARRGPAGTGSGACRPGRHRGRHARLADHPDRGRRRPGHGHRRRVPGPGAGRPPVRLLNHRVTRSPGPGRTSAGHRPPTRGHGRSWPGRRPPRHRPGSYRPRAGRCLRPAVTVALSEAALPR